MWSGANVVKGDSQGSTSKARVGPPVTHSSVDCFEGCLDLDTEDSMNVLVLCAERMGAQGSEQC